MAFFTFAPLATKRPARLRSLCAALVCAAPLLLSPTAPVHANEKKSNEQAEKLLRKGEFDKSEKIFREVLAKDTNNFRARLGLGAALLKQRKVQDAFEQAARATTLDTNSARARALLGATLLAAGNFPLCVQQFRIALSLNENEALAIAGLAMVDFYENRSQTSLYGLRRAVFLDPQEPDYIFSLAQTAARCERYKEAADAYERFLVVSPTTDADRRSRIRGLIDFLRYLGSQRQLYRVSAPSVVTVPFEAAGTRPVIKVRLNNSKEEFRFVIDTGSGMSVISDRTAERLNLRPAARGGMARAIGGGGRFEIVYGFISNFNAREASIDNVPVYIRRFYNDQEKIDGYIGLSLLSKFVSVVDYGARTLTLAKSSNALMTPTAGAAALAAGSVEVPLRMTSSGFLSSEVKLDGIDAVQNFIVDTGASISVVSEALAVREEMGRFMQSTRIKVFGAAGVTENVSALIIPKFAVGPHTRSAVPAVILDLEPINETTGFEQTGIIGGNFLRHYRMTIDFQRATLRLDPLTAAAPARTSSGQVIAPPAAVVSQSAPAAAVKN